MDHIPLMGLTTRIDRAFRLAQAEMFAAENGGREKVGKLLILLTDGTQTEDVDVEDPADIADELRADGGFLSEFVYKQIKRIKRNKEVIGNSVNPAP